MRPFEEMLSGQREVAIQTLAEYIENHIREQWGKVLEESREELLRLYDEAEEAAYGAYAQKLFRPVRKHLESAGFLSEPRFPGKLSTSREWGPPEERERWMWSVVRRGQEAPLGTLVVGLFHDHTQFRIPHAPGVLALEETEYASIVGAISHAAGRRKGGEG